MHRIKVNTDEKVSQDLTRREFIGLIFKTGVVGAGFALVNRAIGSMVDSNRIFEVGVTQTAFGDPDRWEEAVAEGLPQVAVDSAVGVRLNKDNKVAIGSGGVFYTKEGQGDYLVIMSAKHVVLEGGELRLTRPQSMGHKGDLSFPVYGAAWLDGEGAADDFAVLVIKVDEFNRISIESMFPQNGVAKREHVGNVGKGEAFIVTVSINNQNEDAGYPIKGTIGWDKLVLDGKLVVPEVIPLPADPDTAVLRDGKAIPGVSGSVVWQKGEDGLNRCVGVLISDTLNGAIGIVQIPDELDELVENAVKDYKNKAAEYEPTATSTPDQGKLVFAEGAKK